MIDNKNKNLGPSLASLGIALMVVLLYVSCANASKGSEGSVACKVKRNCDTPNATGTNTNQSNPGGKKIPLVGPRFVCNPRCVCYAETNNVDSFLADRCCTFIPCPTSEPFDRTFYNEFKSSVCEDQ